MMYKRNYLDREHGNKALIEEVMCRPYKGAKMQTSFRLVITDEDNFMYHVSVHETLKDAEVEMSKCGRIWSLV